MSCQILHGDCRHILPTIGDATIDAIITDPPYELGFMGKRWDATGIAYDLTVWRECLRVLRSGGHLLAFGGTRTYHRMACAIEDAGFEIRDSIHWLYGSGFPKSLDVSKAIDKAAGAEREVIGKRDGVVRGTGGRYNSHTDADAVGPTVVYDTVSATDAARRWEGWGTALKPAHEPIIVARKPLDGTVAANVLAHGTGALNINGCRIPNEGSPIQRVTGKGVLGGTSDGYDRPWKNDPEQIAARQKRADHAIDVANTLGRWPSNVVIDQHIAEQHPEWANYYYCPKASTTERNTGLDGLQPKSGVRINAPRRSEEEKTKARTNAHPTVKPLNLMRWLCRLITPPDGTILDPFAGSGTTLTAAILEHFNTIGIELTDEYHPIIQARTSWAQTNIDSQLPL